VASPEVMSRCSSVIDTSTTVTWACSGAEGTASTALIAMSPENREPFMNILPSEVFE
jgi:hypothetical protein